MVSAYRFNHSLQGGFVVSVVFVIHIYQPIFVGLSSFVGCCLSFECSSLNEIEEVGYQFAVFSGDIRRELHAEDFPVAKR